MFTTFVEPNMYAVDPITSNKKLTVSRSHRKSLGKQTRDKKDRDVILNLGAGAERQPCIYVILSAFSPTELTEDSLLSIFYHC